MLHSSYLVLALLISAAPCHETGVTNHSSNTYNAKQFPSMKSTIWQPSNNKLGTFRNATHFLQNELVFSE